MQPRALLLLFVLLLIQAAPVKSLLSAPTPFCQTSTDLGQPLQKTAACCSGNIEQEDREGSRRHPALQDVLPSQNTENAASTALNAASTALNAASTALNATACSNPESGTVQTVVEYSKDECCGHCCTCKTEPLPSAPADYPANTAPQSKSLVPEISWLLAGLQSFIRNLPALVSSRDALMQSLCAVPVLAVERSILHCTFQT